MLRLPRSEVPGGPLGREHRHEYRVGGRNGGVGRVPVGCECRKTAGEPTTMGRDHACRTPRRGYACTGDTKARPTGHWGLEERHCHRGHLSVRSRTCDGCVANHAAQHRVKEVSVTLADIGLRLRARCESGGPAVEAQRRRRTRRRQPLERVLRVRWASRRSAAETANTEAPAPRVRCARAGFRLPARAAHRHATR